MPEISVLGWCWSPTHDILGLTLRAGSTEVPCLYGIERPDVAEAFKNNRAHNSGFVCRIPVSGQESKIQLIGTLDGVRQVLTDIAIPARPGPDSSGGIRTYSDWLRFNEPRIFWPLPEVPERIRRLSATPTISIILPTYNTPLYYLHRCIQSVSNQHYPFWQLCIADDGSTDPDILTYLRQNATREPRIALELRRKCEGTSAASNSALRLATGEFIALLDHDDELHPAALLELVRCINSSPEADLIFSDEDKIDDEGHRFAPSFKPDYDPEIILAFNYFGHLVCIRRTLIEELQGFRAECDGSQDWDLLLRVIEQTNRERIRHVPKPLYHWRCHPNSTAMTLAAKPHVHQAWHRLLKDHISRVGKSARPYEGLFIGSMQIRSTRVKATTIAVVYRFGDGVHQRTAIQRTSPSDLRLYELVFSRLHSMEDPLRNPLLTLGELDCDIVVFLNAPVESFSHSFFQVLASLADRSDCGIAGPLILGSNGYVRSAGFYGREDGSLINPFAGLKHSALGYMGLAKVSRSVAAIGSGCFAVRKARLQSVGGLAMLAEDTLTNVCCRLISSAHTEGLHVLYTPYAVIMVRAEAEDEAPVSEPLLPSHLRINPSIEAFQNPGDLFRESEIS